MYATIEYNYTHITTRNSSMATEKLTGLTINNGVNKIKDLDLVRIRKLQKNFDRYNTKHKRDLSLKEFTTEKCKIDKTIFVSLKSYTDRKLVLFNLMIFKLSGGIVIYDNARISVELRKNNGCNVIKYINKRIDDVIVRLKAKFGYKFHNKVTASLSNITFLQRVELYGKTNYLHNFDIDNNNVYISNILKHSLIPGRWILNWLVTDADDKLKNLVMNSTRNTSFNSKKIRCARYARKAIIVYITIIKTWYLHNKLTLINMSFYSEYAIRGKKWSNDFLMIKSHIDSSKTFIEATKQLFNYLLYRVKYDITCYRKTKDESKEIENDEKFVDIFYEKQMVPSLLELNRGIKCSSDSDGNNSSSNGIRYVITHNSKYKRSNK